MSDTQLFQHCLIRFKDKLQMEGDWLIIKPTAMIGTKVHLILFAILASITLIGLIYLIPLLLYRLKIHVKTGKVAWQVLWMEQQIGQLEDMDVSISQVNLLWRTVPIGFLFHLHYGRQELSPPLYRGLFRAQRLGDIRTLDTVIRTIRMQTQIK